MSKRFVCILCCRQIDRRFGYYNIGDTSIESSKKTIKNILIHLSKCIKIEFCFEDSSCVCNPCHEKVSEYDQIMVQLLYHQKSLSQMLQNSIQFFNEIKTKPCTNNIAENEIIIKDELQDSDSNISIKHDFDDGMEDDVRDTDSDYTNDASDQNRITHSFDCTICDKSLKSQRALKIHLDTHSNVVKCSICGALRKDEEYLELHMNVHEGKTENDCRFCDKRYSRRANVIRHMHLHWDKKKFQCEKCGLRFSQANLLYNHKMLHEAEEQPIICQICDQTFKSKKTFKHHMVTHQEDRPRHPCEICGKKFTERYTLKMHLKTHMNSKDEEQEPPKKTIPQIKNFMCIICDRGFGTMESLDTHKVKEHDVICSEGVMVNFF